MPASLADLKALQGKIKRDPGGYKEEFLLQQRHYRALLEIFLLKPSKDSEEFADLVDFLSHVSGCYPEDSLTYADELIDLLEKNYAILDHNLRRALVQALILIRNRGRLAATKLLPLFFRLFRCADKKLRSLLFKHIVVDIQNSNKKHRDERLNRTIQNFLYTQLQDDHEMCAKKSLAVLTELYRRKVWVDQRSVNVIASACFHKSNSVMIASLKFFLGQDEKELNADGESDDDGDDNKVDRQAQINNAAAVSIKKEDVYRAYAKGVAASKKKKQAKLKRTLKKAKRDLSVARSEGDKQAVFAALQLLNDPQGFAEKLFARVQGSSTHRFETKLLILSVVSRVIGTHNLLVLHFYPFIQKYLQPSQREATKLLAIAVQACHDQVPPDVVEPLLRQLVNQFVHDKSRPEVMAVGLQSVREMCLRTPLVMTPELLQDLTEYKKDRDKGVRMAARSLITLFRELAPGMLVKKDRGKAADMDRQVKQYGQVEKTTRVLGAELLLLKDRNSDDELSDSEDEDDSEDE
eukprot:CAMPEP_0198213366 /NCGR_PEP_ID=MMETSP1445-20131203/28822_1 /TAXON_ID=36898 /ORGANISM="Pyramimonas sp., Strain CCMP2087" /LENGTH=521 /DNA_ID=CAMNT_0043887993 /DNA_START=119 /DNA_END=1681 /DNA_ORIENTATION=-